MNAKTIWIIIGVVLLAIIGIGIGIYAAGRGASQDESVVENSQEISTENESIPVIPVSPSDTEGNPLPPPVSTLFNQNPIDPADLDTSLPLPVSEEDTNEIMTPRVILGTATVSALELVALDDSDPVRVQARITGTVPDGCTRVRNPVLTRTGNRFLITLETERDQGAICTTVITPFERIVALEVGELAPGSYSVTANGVMETFRLEEGARQRK